MGITDSQAADDWAGERGHRWLRDVDLMNEQLAPVGEALLDRADIAPGEHVLDIGCGAGWTTRRIADATGPGELALGLDISEALLAGAGFRDIHRELLELPMWIGGPGATPAQAAAFALRSFSVGACAEAAGPDVLQAATADLERLYAGRATREGVALPAAVWLLSARRAHDT